MATKKKAAKAKVHTRLFDPKNPNYNVRIRTANLKKYGAPAISGRRLVMRSELKAAA